MYIIHVPTFVCVFLNDYCCENEHYSILYFVCIFTCVVVTLPCVHFSGAPPIKKCFYYEDAEVAGLDSAQVEDIW